MSLRARVRRLFMRNARFEHLLCLALKSRRLTLPVIDIHELHADADAAVVTVRALPAGPWATPLADAVHLLKLVKLRNPRTVLELGCYKGHTTAAIADHLPASARLVTVDVDPAAGEAFRHSVAASRIELRIGHTGPQLFHQDAPGSYDFIFVDADHSYGGVKRDTELALSLVSPGGLIVWHDYANWGYFSGYCRVPEYLGELSARLPIRHLAGSSLAIYAPAWGTAGPSGQRT